ncbi:hypothetical protein BDR22DRAFT_427517 [Usnea florida]
MAGPPLAVRRRNLWNRLKAAILGPSSEEPDGRVRQITPSLDDYKSGYGKVAAIEDLDADFLVFRKFGWLHNYALLYLQDELAQQQDELESFDQWEHDKGNPTKLVSRRLDQSFHKSRRKELVDKLHVTLTRYDELLLRMQKIQAIKRPTQRSQKNISNLILNTHNLVSDESDWIRHGSDLAALGCGAEYGWLNTSLEDALNKISKSMTMKLFRSAEQKLKTGNEEGLRLLSADRLDILLHIVLTIIATVLLLVPVFTLFRLQPTCRADIRRKSNYQLLTVFIFTLIFSASCCIFTNARRQEVLTATAAYCAVLVVFLGNTSTAMFSQDNI